MVTINNLLICVYFIASVISNCIQLLVQDLENACDAPLTALIKVQCSSFLLQVTRIESKISLKWLPEEMATFEAINTYLSWFFSSHHFLLVVKLTVKLFRVTLIIIRDKHDKVKSTRKN